MRAACLALALPATFVYAGREGSAAHTAARSRFGPIANLVASEGTSSALEEVLRKRADFAVVPLETKSEGLSRDTILQLAATDLKIVQVVDFSATLHLVNRTGNTADIEKIYTTAEDHAFSQRFLEQPLTGRHAVVSSMTFRRLGPGRPRFVQDAGAQGWPAPASSKDGPCFPARLGARTSLDDRLPDRAGRSRRRRPRLRGVRHAAGARAPASHRRRHRAERATRCVGTRLEPGETTSPRSCSTSRTRRALSRSLQKLAERGSTSCASSPTPASGPGWSYLFFVEIGGHATDRFLVAAFEEVKRQTKFFKVLGSYGSGR